MIVPQSPDLFSFKIRQSITSILASGKLATSCNNDLLLDDPCLRAAHTLIHQLRPSIPPPFGLQKIQTDQTRLFLHCRTCSLPNQDHDWSTWPARAGQWLLGDFCAKLFAKDHGPQSSKIRRFRERLNRPALACSSNLLVDIFAQHEHDAGEPNYPECADIDQLFDRVLGELLEPYKAKRFGGELQLEEALFHSLSSTGKMLSLLTGPPASLRRSGRGATVTGTCGYHRSLQCLHSETFRYQYERCFVREYGLMAGRAYVESRCLNTSYHLVLCAIEGSILPWARIRASSKLVASSEPMYCPGLSLCRAKPSQSRSVKRPSLVASYLLLT